MTYMYMYMHVLLSVFFGGHNRLTEQTFGFAFIFHELIPLSPTLVMVTDLNDAL